MAPAAAPPLGGLTHIEIARKNNHSKVTLWMGRRQNGLERACGDKGSGEDILCWHVVDRLAGHCAMLWDTWLQSTSFLNDSL
jgi:hypothetical protein